MTRLLHILALLSEPLVDAAGNPVPRLGLEREMQRIRHQLAALGRAGVLQFCIATPGNLLTALCNGPADLLFFSGHGNEGELAFEDGRGGIYAMDVPHLQALFAPLGGPPCQVAFLSACHSENVAQALLATGVPHVVAVDAAQPILDLAAQAFAVHFLSFLAAGHPVRRAFEAGRAAVFTDPDTKRALQQWLAAEAARDPRIAALVAQQPQLADILQQLEALKFTLLPEPGAGAPDPHANIPFPNVPRGALKVHDLPDPPKELGRTPEFFVGRERDLHKVLQLVLDHRLTTIRGGGGVGKTELAREVGRWCARRGLFPGGIFFVSLGGLGGTITPVDARVAVAAAVAAGQDLASITADDHALAAALPRDSLLILDELDALCFVQLRAARALLEALANSGHAHVLTTSRQASGAAGEYCHELRRLHPPADRQLFLQLSQARVGPLRGSEVELAEVLKFLDGVPRAIHLAAKQMDTPDLSALLAGLRQAREAILHDPDIPSEERTDHESVLVTLESSFRRLQQRDGEAAVFFPRLALFPAGIPAQGLEAIFGAEALRLVHVIHDLSLVDLEPPLDSYYLPAPTRHYAERLLTPVRDEIMSSYGKQALHYFAGVAEALDALITHGQLELGIALTARELPNLHLWLDWGFEAEEGQGDGACQVARTMAALSNFYRFLDALRQEAITRYRRAYDCAQRMGDRKGQANTLMSLGDLALRTAELGQARVYYETALQLFEQIDNKLGQANTRLGMGDLAERLGQADVALAHYQTALALYRQIGDRYNLARAILLSFAPFCLRHGRVDEAFRAYAEGLMATLPLDAAFFLAFLHGALQQVRDLVRAQPAQAAQGCAFLLQELGLDLEGAGAKEDDRTTFLLTTARLIFQVSGLVAIARAESGEERRATFGRARELAAHVDQATNGVFALIAWVDEMSGMP
ncbi:MAG: hypothetical protein DDG58_13875 [Ardenticatenia bacterium]|nr:MAG: hypothetical protein DDG58_13875 [Ardenticatenia bacterium]